MANYYYQCTSCKRVAEVQHGMSETPEVRCPTCNAEAKRYWGVMPGELLMIKGKGFCNETKLY